MSWTPVLAHWPHLMDQLGARFQHLDRQAMDRFRGDRLRLVKYLAQTHDLTVAEAGDTLDDFLLTQCRQTSQAKAA